jgi:hypothetical protein
MTENVIFVTFEPLITMALIERKNIKAIIEMAIKEVIKDAEKNHRVYKLEDLLDELDDED